MNEQPELRMQTVPLAVSHERSTSATIPRISVVIPAWNEEGSIGRVIDALPKEWVCSVIVADNNSTDHDTPIISGAEKGTGYWRGKKGTPPSFSKASSGANTRRRPLFLFPTCPTKLTSLTGQGNLSALVKLRVVHVRGMLGKAVRIRHCPATVSGM